MKLGPVTKLDKRSMTTSTKFDDDVVLADYDIIIIFQFMVDFEQSRTWISAA